MAKKKRNLQEKNLQVTIKEIIVALSPSNKYPIVRPTPSNRQILAVVTVPEPHKFKLLRIILMKKRYGYTHQPVIVTRNILCLVYVNRVTIVLFRILFLMTAIFLYKRYHPFS